MHKLCGHYSDRPAAMHIWLCGKRLQWWRVCLHIEYMSGSGRYRPVRTDNSHVLAWLRHVMQVSYIS